MWPFTNSEAAPEPQAPQVSLAFREASLRAQLRGVNSELSALDAEIGEFRKVHSLQTNRFQQIIAAQDANMTGRAAIESAWRAMQLRAGQLLKRRGEVMAEWSEVKNATRKEIKWRHPQL